MQTPCGTHCYIAEADRDVKPPTSSKSKIFSCWDSPLNLSMYDSVTRSASQVFKTRDSVWLKGDGDIFVLRITLHIFPHDSSWHTVSGTFLKKSFGSRDENLK